MLTILLVEVAVCTVWFAMNFGRSVVLNTFDQGLSILLKSGKEFDSECLELCSSSGLSECRKHKELPVVSLSTEIRSGSSDLL
jgi:hypothetical protein